MSSGFASTADLADKTITFDAIGPDLYAFTAEGDPNSGVIVGDDGVMVVDAQATPVMAQQVIDRVKKVTDKPIKYVLLNSLSCRARAGRFGLSRGGNPGVRRHPQPDRRARQGRHGFRDRPLPALVSRGRKHSRPDLALDHVSRSDLGLARQARGADHAYRPRPHRGRCGRLCAGRQRRVFRRSRRVSLGLLLRRRAFHRLAGDARSARRILRKRARCRAAAPRSRAPSRSPKASR